ncbi:MAG: hypothetical protein MUF72_09710 [Elainella sp. Prado103]|nr:hypothetical protein [Elainella sp. Prado103]
MRTGRFGSRQPQAALDSSPAWGIGRAEDTDSADSIQSPPPMTVPEYVPECVPEYIPECISECVPE